MTAAAILTLVRARGVRLHLLDGDRLAVSPKVAVNDDLRRLVREHKAEIVSALRSMRQSFDPNSPPTPCQVCDGFVFYRPDPAPGELRCATCILCADVTSARWYSGAPADDPLRELLASVTAEALASYDQQAPAVVEEVLARVRQLDTLPADATDRPMLTAELIDLVATIRAQWEGACV